MGRNFVEIEGTMRWKPITYMVLGHRRCMFTVRVAKENVERGYDYVDCMAQDDMAQKITDLASEFCAVHVEGRISTNRNTYENKKRVTVIVDKWELLK